MSSDPQTANGKRDIAIIGMACVLPKAHDLREFWQNLVDKVDGISEGVPEWVQHYYDPEMKEVARIYTKKGGFIDRETRFDPLEFGIMPNTVDGTTPDHFLALKACKDALMDAGYWENKPFDRTRTGVILGYGPNANRGNLVAFQHGMVVDQTLGIIKNLLPDIDPGLLTEIRHDIESGLPPLRPEIVPGFVANVLTGRIANRLDLMGPNYIVDAACSASFISLDVAIKELQSGRSDMILAGGVNVSMPPQMLMVFSIIEALTREDVRPFDKNASGVLLGEGLGVFVLKRLGDAERDNDRIYAVIKGMSLASDGKSKGLLAPRYEGEVLAMERAYEETGISRDTVSLIEAHGTGIPIGDETEAHSIKTVFGDRPENGVKIALGGVKSMLGHSLMAAGSAGMIKTVLGLYHKTYPPTLCDEINPSLELDKSPIYVNNQTRPWIHGESHPRRAGVNAFGFGGIDGHCIVEEYTGPGSRNHKLMDREWPHELLLFHGKSQDEVLDQVRDIIAVIEHPRRFLFKDIAYSLVSSAENGFGPVRLAVIVGRDRNEAVERLKDAIEKVQAGKANRVRGRNGIFYGDTPVEGKIAFLYPGHGAQYQGMFADLNRCFPRFREWFDLMDELYGAELGIRPSMMLYPPPTVWTEQQRQEAALQLFTSDVSIAVTNFPANAMDELVRGTLGIEPDVMIGHSTGELNAISASGHFKLTGKDALKQTTRELIDVFLSYRDELGGLPTGALLTVGAADHKLVERIIAESKGALSFVLDNCPNQVLVYGSEQAILEAKPKFEKAGGICERMPFNRAFHTPEFKGVSEKLFARFKTKNFGPGPVRLFSATRGGYYPADPEKIRRWAADLWSEPVMFRGAIEKLHDDGVRIFVEVGANATVTAFVTDTLSGKDYVAVATNNQRRGDLEQLNTMLATLFVIGRNPRFAGMYEHREVQLVPVRPDRIEAVKRRSTDQVLERDVATMRLSDKMLAKLNALYPNRGLARPGATVAETASPAPSMGNGMSQWKESPGDASVIPPGVPVSAAYPQSGTAPAFDPYGLPPGYPPPPRPPFLDPSTGLPLPFDFFGNPIPQPPFDPYAPPPWDPYGLNAGYPPYPPLPMLDAWGNPLPPPGFDPFAPPPLLDAWGNPLPPPGFNPFAAPLFDPYGMAPPYDPYSRPCLPPEPSAPHPVLEPPAPPVRTVPTAAEIATAEVPVSMPEAAPVIPAPAIPASPAVPVGAGNGSPATVDLHHLPFGKKPLLTHNQLIAQLSDPSVPDAPEHLLMRFDPRLAVESPHYPRPDFDGLPFERAYPLLGKIVRQDDNLLECERHLDVKQDPVLKSHAFGGPPSRYQKHLRPMAIVPFVMSLEICAEAAHCLMKGRKFAKEFRLIRGHRWLALLDGTLDIMIKAKKLKDLDGGDTLVRTEIYQYHKHRDGRLEPHLTYEAMVVAGDREYEPLAPMPFRVRDPKYSHLTTEMLYNDGIYYSMNYPGRFHGRHFRAIRHIRHYSPHTIEVEMEAPDWHDLFTRIEDPVFQLNMFIMDGAVLQVGFWYTEVFAMDTNLFPFMIKSAKILGGPPPPGRRLIGRALMRLTGIGDIKLDSNPYFNYLDKHGNLIYQMDENSLEGFSFPDNYYKSQMLPNLSCVEGTVDVLDAETGHVYAHIEGWQNRFFEIPVRYDKVTLFSHDFTLSETWMNQETGYRMRINEPFEEGLLEGSWGVWGSKLAHTMLTEAEKKQYYSFSEGSSRREDWLMGRIAAKELLIDWIVNETIEDRYNPIDIEIRMDEHGKPYGVCTPLPELKLPEISIAHSKRYAVAATSGSQNPIGVDYEWLNSFDHEDVLTGGFSADCIEQIKRLPESEHMRATAALWCSKEAAAKALGQGLNHEPREWRINRFDMNQGSAEIRYRDRIFPTRFWYSSEGEVVAICELKPAGGRDSATGSAENLGQPQPRVIVQPESVTPESVSVSSNGGEAKHAAVLKEATQVETGWDNPDREPTELEQQLIALWEELLDVDDVGLHDDFFELGGESVMAVRLIGRVEKMMGRSIPVANFLKTRTVEQMARILSDKDWVPDWSSLVPMRASGDRIPLFFTHPVGGNVLKYRELMSFIPEEQPLYALQARGLDGSEEPFDNVPEMAEYYLKGIRAAQAEGPYLLAGFSGGGVISWEMAWQLEQAGEEVALLALFDTFGPDYYTFEMGGSRLPHQLETFLWRIELHLETMATLTFPQKLAYVQRKLKHGNRKGRAGSGGIIRRIEDVTYEAVLSYQPKPLKKIPVHLFRASRQPKQSTGDPQLNWGPYVAEGNLSVHAVHGTHGHLVEEPHVAGLAKSLNEVLEQTHTRFQTLMMSV